MRRTDEECLRILAAYREEIARAVADDDPGSDCHGARRRICFAGGR